MNTTLHAAARSGNDRLLNYVLQAIKKESVIASEIKNSYLDVNVRNATGATPLELAAVEGDHGNKHLAVLYLHDLCYINTYMAYVMSLGHLQAVAILINHGASPFVPDSNHKLLSSVQYEGVKHSLTQMRRTHAKRLLFYSTWFLCLTLAIFLFCTGSCYS